MKIETILPTNMERCDPVQGSNSICLELYPSRGTAHLGSVNFANTHANAYQTINITIKLMCEGCQPSAGAGRTTARSA